MSGRHVRTELNVEDDVAPFTHDVCACGRRAPRTMSRLELASETKVWGRVQRSAAKLRISTDRKLGRTTPRFLFELADETGQPVLGPGWEKKPSPALHGKPARGVAAAAMVARHSRSSRRKHAVNGTTIEPMPVFAGRLTPAGQDHRAVDPSSRRRGSRRLGRGPTYRGRHRTAGRTEKPHPLGYSRQSRPCSGVLTGHARNGCGNADANGGRDRLEPPRIGVFGIVSDLAQGHEGLGPKEAESI